MALLEKLATRPSRSLPVTGRERENLVDHLLPPQTSGTPATIAAARARLSPATGANPIWLPDQRSTPIMPKPARRIPLRDAVFVTTWPIQKRLAQSESAS